MKKDLPKITEKEKQAEAVQGRLGLFAYWRRKLPELPDFSGETRSLRKIARAVWHDTGRILRQVTRNTANLQLKGKLLPHRRQHTPKDQVSLPEIEDESELYKLQETKSVISAPEQEADSAVKSNLPLFLQNKGQNIPDFDDLKRFPNSEPELALAAREQDPAREAKMPLVLEEMKKKLNFEFLNGKTDKLGSKAVSKDSSYDLSKLDETQSRAILSKIYVVAFVGPSGTGKSTRANQVAFLSKCSYIIDDALLIKENHIVAGSSAKRAGTKIESVRQAIFFDPIRAQTMRRALISQQPGRLLILGTSEAMIKKICKALWLQFPSEWINITDVATASEINQARYNRIHTGQHAIPVPSMELKHEFSGSIFEPLNLLRQRFINKESENKDKENGNVPLTAASVLISGGKMPLQVEQSIVRPSFSVLGHYSITDQALKNIVLYSLQKVKAVHRLRDCEVQQETSGLVFKIKLSLYYGYNAQKALQEAQAAVIEAVSNLTAMNILQVSLLAEALVVKKSE